ncbi:hypothetical protein DVH24_004206 [Malus domestica]|uniref:Uncharacterized protein n=1 Tax=Malus domestica TaxID=3750 RepID=A0A498KB25_MALDO|nr:hypothetical protein DVH24_004206 [Malus domestica]
MVLYHSSPVKTTLSSVEQQSVLRLGGVLMQDQLDKEAKRLKLVLWENEDLETFPIFPSSVRYMFGKIRVKSTFPIFLQNFPEDKSTPKLVCKTVDLFPKPRMILS